MVILKKGCTDLLKFEIVSNFNLDATTGQMAPQWNFALRSSSMFWHKIEGSLAHATAMLYSEHKQALLASFSAN